jgi:5-methyltetrahydrofolate--homocysteine methyltransferase
MTPLLERIRAGEVLVADGAIGTHLLRAGIPPGSSFEALNESSPETIEAIAASYVAAGADIVQTNSFGASPLLLERHGLAGKVEAINRVAVRIARRAAGGRALVAASCGPSGAILKPYGDADPGAVAASFRLQLHALASEGIDLVCIETMTDLGEALLALEAAREAAPGVPVSVSLTYDETPRGFFTVMGAGASRAARAIEEAGGDIVGSNCGSGVAAFARIARELRSATRLPLLIRPNAGLPELRGAEAVYPETPADFEEHVPALLGSGVSILGGCCGTTAEHIRAIRRAVDRRSPGLRSR